MDSTTEGRRAPGQSRGRSGPPPRRDPRGPGPGTVPSGGVRRRHSRDLLPRYWFANRLLLTLSGQKPVHWMLGHTVGAAYEQLVRLAPLAPLAPLRSPRGPVVPAPVVARCNEYRPEPDVIEAYARIACGERVRALAFRLEHGRDERWRCAAVDLGVDADIRSGAGAPPA